MNQSNSQEPVAVNGSAELSPRACLLILVVAFLSWMFAGTQLSITGLAMRPAAVDLLTSPDDVVVNQWVAWLTCAFLFGAALGGLLFGWVGDRFGRVRGLALAVSCYSVFSGLTYFVESTEQLLVLRFIASLGIGGTWPNGVALVAEAWSNLSRPMLAGILGTSANVGIAATSLLATRVDIRPDSWRWVMIVGAAPILVAMLAWFLVPESPLWQRQAARRRDGSAPDPGDPASPIRTVFRPPLLSRTLIGIGLGSVALIGGWGSTQWVVPWADKVGSALDEPDHALKAYTQFFRSFAGIFGSLLGGWIASRVGRRRSYFAMSVFSFVLAQYLFRYLSPDYGSFLVVVAALGFWSTMYFGWLPLCLPELFPTQVRSTGSGVSFNFGRFLSAATLFATGALKDYFQGEHSKIGTVTSFVFLAGMVLIWFAPDTESSDLSVEGLDSSSASSENDTR